MCLSHAHLLLQLGRKAGAIGAVDVTTASVSIATAWAVVLSSIRVWLGEKALGMVV